MGLNRASARPALSRAVRCIASKSLIGSKTVLRTASSAESGILRPDNSIVRSISARCSLLHRASILAVAIAVFWYTAWKHNCTAIPRTHQRRLTKFSRCKSLPQSGSIVWEDSSIRGHGPMQVCIFRTELQVYSNMNIPNQRLGEDSSALVHPRQWCR